MRIEYDVKLDFRDVMIRPKRSVLKSRAEVSLEREFQFKHTQTVWQGVLYYRRQYGPYRHRQYGKSIG